MASSLTFMSHPMVAGEASGSAVVLDLGFSFAMAFRLVSNVALPEYSPQVIVGFSCPTMSATTPSANPARIASESWCPSEG